MRKEKKENLGKYDVHLYATKRDMSSKCDNLGSHHVLWKSSLFCSNESQSLGSRISGEVPLLKLQPSLKIRLTVDFGSHGKINRHFHVEVCTRFHHPMVPISKLQRDQEWERNYVDPMFIYSSKHE